MPCMKKPLTAIVLFACAATLASAEPTKTYYVYFLKLARKDAIKTGFTEAEKMVLAEHSKYHARLAKEGVEIVGGHLTLGADEPALSASCTGLATRPLLARNARPGDELLAAFCLDGRYGAQTLFFSSLRDRAPESLRDDGEALVEVAESGAAHAARDVSMPGVAGSLLQLLETAGCGATLELERVPRPAGVSLERWLLTFPSFGFLLAAAPGARANAAEPFLRRGLACAPCGRLDDSRVLRLAASGHTAALWDLNADPFTHLDPAGST